MQYTNWPNKAEELVRLLECWLGQSSINIYSLSAGTSTMKFKILFTHFKVNFMPVWYKQFQKNRNKVKCKLNT